MAARSPHKIKALIVSTETRSVVRAIEPHFTDDGKLVDNEFIIPDDKPDEVILPYVYGQQIYIMYGRSGSGKTTMIQTLMSLFCSVQPYYGWKEEGSQNIVLVISNKETDPSLLREHPHSFIHIKKEMKAPTLYWKKLDWWKTYRPELGEGITIDKVFAFYQDFANGPSSHGLVIIDDLIVRNNKDNDNVAAFVSNFVQMYRQYKFTLFLSKHSMSPRDDVQSKKEADYAFIFPNTPLPGLRKYLEDTVSSTLVNPIVKHINDLTLKEFETPVGVSYLAVRALGGIMISRRSIKRETEEENLVVYRGPRKREHGGKQNEEGGEDQEDGAPKRRIAITSL